MLVHTLDPHDGAVVLSRVDEVAVDDLWSFVGKKKDQRWFWHAIDPGSGWVLASVVGRR